MGLKGWIAKQWGKQVAAQHAAAHRNGSEVQASVLSSLLNTAQHTRFAQEHRMQAGMSVESFRDHVPVRDYEAGRAWFERVAVGEPNVLWPGKPLYLAKTSGTTSGAKYIPITRESIRYQIKGARDLLLLHCLRSGTDFLDGKMLFLSGSPVLEMGVGGIRTGRLSGIVNHYVPAYLRRSQVPDWDTNCIEDWETKVDRIVRQVVKEDLRLISGIPPWVHMFFEHAEQVTGKPVPEIWPNLQLYVMGGVDFTPYRAVLEPYFPQAVQIRETFPASEGFFAIDDASGQEGMLLNLNTGIFYEFIALEEYGLPGARRRGLREVELGVQYAMVVSTNAGLWAYDIGDTIRFTSLSPYRIKVTGRVKHFISTFGEHIIAEEVNDAMVQACGQTGAEINDFTVAPLVRPGSGESCHEWLIEFSAVPPDLEVFIRHLDVAMQFRNPYYRDLREGNILKMPEVRCLAKDAIRDLMKADGKLGGQNKFPRLTNNRALADRLYAYLLPA